MMMKRRRMLDATPHTVKIHRSSNGPTRRKRMLTTRATQFTENVNSSRAFGFISLLNFSNAIARAHSSYSSL